MRSKSRICRRCRRSQPSASCWSCIFIAWLFAAQIFYQQLFGPNPPDSLSGFITEIFSTARGWALIILGHAIGFVFAAVVLCTTVVAFPLLLDRDVGAYEAIHASVRAVLANPIPMAAWGLIVAVLLIVGSLPVFAGLAVVLPILGHATWHLYRKVVGAGAVGAQPGLRLPRAGRQCARPARNPAASTALTNPEEKRLPARAEEARN